MNSSTTGDSSPAPSTRIWSARRDWLVRRSWSAACILATAVVLTGCTDDPTDPAPDGSRQTPSPGQTAGDVTSPSDSPSEPSPSPSTTAPGQWGSYSNRTEACTAVAADVVAIAVLPMSLNLSGDAKQIDNAEDEIEAMRRSAPAELEADFARVQLLIDSYGERVAAGERGGGEDTRVESSTEDGGGDRSRDDGTGSGSAPGEDDGATVQSPSTDPPGSSKEPELKRDALQDALDPIKQWLTENCERSPDG
ncbi:hypothetical protein [Arthrobacter pigmenti]